MFTGIIEELGTVKAIEKQNGNLVFTIEAGFAKELKLNESVCHNGACLSVKPVSKKLYKVTAVQETLNKTNLKYLKSGTKVNLERSLKADGRIDGHFVLGHVDGVVKCMSVKKLAGSHTYTFACTKNDRKYLVPKGSIALNGISLTIASLTNQSFSVAVIPYTFEHTNLKNLQAGDEVNVEYDVLGKYVLGVKN